MIKSEKQETIAQLHERFQGSSSAICVSFRGIDVDTITTFRQELKKASGNYQVVKNTLARRAVKETSFEGLGDFLVGPTGIIFCPEEVSDLAKVASKFVDDTNGALEIKGGVVEGVVFDAAGIKKVATLPSRQELLAQLVSSLQSPVSGLVGTLQGVVREFVYTLQAVADKKAAEQ